jgi:hypothetical protein
MSNYFLILGILYNKLFSPENYLDPGSGSFFLQLLLASIVGALFVFKSYWRRLISSLRGKVEDNKNDNDDEN